MATILIADDHADITRILVDYAKNEGYHVLVAHDGEEALRLFEKTSGRSSVARRHDAEERRL